MFTQSAAEKDPSAAVVPEIRPRMPWRVAEVTAPDGFRLRVRFPDGMEGTVDLSGLVHSDHAGAFFVLSDTETFSKVSVEHGAVVWPGEIDLASDAMYRAIRNDGGWILRQGWAPSTRFAKLRKSYT